MGSYSREVHRERRRGNDLRWQQEKFWLNVKKKNPYECGEVLELVVQRGCGTSTLGDFQVMTGHSPEQHGLTSDLVLL